MNYNIVAMTRRIEEVIIERQNKKGARSGNSVHRKHGDEASEHTSSHIVRFYVSVALSSMMIGDKMNYHYYVNKERQSNGDNEVHKETCSYLPLPRNRIDLGLHSTDQSALRAAKQYYPFTADGCYHCCPSIHKR